MNRHSAKLVLAKAGSGNPENRLDSPGSRTGHIFIYELNFSLRPQRTLR